jgi:hypothetical protein
MNATVALPSTKDIKALFDGMLGRNVEVGMGNSWSPTAKEPAVVAEYVTDRTVLGALAMTDLDLSVLAGAAMGLLPRGGAEDMISERNPTADVMANLYEILNVLASTLNKSDAVHLRLTTMHEFDDTLPGDVAATVAAVLNRLDLVIEIPGYGKGRLAVLTAA